MAKTGPKPVAPEIRFWRKVNRDGPVPEHAPQLGPCWLWTGYANPTGRGHFIPQSGTVLQSHRFAYEAMNGPIPDDAELDHLCRRPICVRPTHLEPVSHAENARRHFATITHCPKGHPYDDGYRRKASNKRVCRTCAADRAREWRRRRAAERTANRTTQPQP